jgi:hypothetical protein
MLQEEIKEFIDIDNSNQEIAKNSLVKIVSLLSKQFTNDNFNTSTGYIKIVLLITEIVKEVEQLSIIHKHLSSIDKKQIAIHLGYLVLLEIYKSNPTLLKSYFNIYKEHVEPTLEMMISVSKVVNISNPILDEKIKKCCGCF